MNFSTWKRLAILMSVLALCIFLAGCKDDDSSYEEPASTPVAAQSSNATSKAKSAPAATAAAATEEATKSASAAATKEPEAPKAAAETETKMNQEEKENLAQMGHTLPAPPANRPHLAADVPTVERDVTGVVLTVPASWKETPKEELSTMRVAQFALPPAAGSKEGAELVAFNFGAGQGGSMMANIERWLTQVKVDENTRPHIYQHEVNGLKVAEVYAKGTLQPSSMGAGPKEPQADAALYGIIIEGAPTGNVFLKITGDRKTIEAAEPALVTLVDSVKVGKP